MKHDGEGNSEISAGIGQATKAPRGTVTFFTGPTPTSTSCPTSPSRDDPCDVDDHLTIDLQYTYRLPELGFQQEGSMVQLGIINATDEDPPRVNDDPGFIPNLHDSRGRLYYLRYTMNLF